jgi:hypothetical protein
VNVSPALHAVAAVAVAAIAAAVALAAAAVAVAVVAVRVVALAARVSLAFIHLVSLPLCINSGTSLYRSESSTTTSTYINLPATNAILLCIRAHLSTKAVQVFEIVLVFMLC